MQAAAVKDAMLLAVLHACAHTHARAHARAQVKGSKADAMKQIHGLYNLFVKVGYCDMLCEHTCVMYGGTGVFTCTSW